MKQKSILDQIGNTPIVPISRLNSFKNVQIFAKLEAFNPGGSVKDRIALNMIEDAEQKGELTPDRIVLEATSGNTGIALAMAAAVMGYRMVLIMPDNMSEERRAAMKAYGAELISVTTQQRMEEARDLALSMKDGVKGIVLCECIKY